MSQQDNLHEIRKAALDRAERSEKSFRLALFGGLAWEALFLVAFLLAADLSNPLHRLLLIATVGSYSVVVIGLVALGAHITRNTLRVLKAIDLLEPRAAEELR